MLRSCLIWYAVFHGSVTVLMVATLDPLTLIGLGSFFASVNQYRRRTPEPFAILRSPS